MCSAWTLKHMIDDLFYVEQRYLEHEYLNVCVEREALEHMSVYIFIEWEAMEHMIYENIFVEHEAMKHMKR